MYKFIFLDNNNDKNTYLCKIVNYKNEKYGNIFYLRH